MWEKIFLADIILIFSSFTLLHDQSHNTKLFPSFLMISSDFHNYEKNHFKKLSKEDEKQRLTFKCLFHFILWYDMSVERKREKNDHLQTHTKICEHALRLMNIKWMKHSDEFSVCIFSYVHLNLLSSATKSHFNLYLIKQCLYNVCVYPLSTYKVNRECYEQVIDLMCIGGLFLKRSNFGWRFLKFYRLKIENFKKFLESQQKFFKIKINDLEVFQRSLKIFSLQYWHFFSQKNGLS